MDSGGQWWTVWWPRAASALRALHTSPRVCIAVARKTQVSFPVLVGFARWVCASRCLRARGDTRHKGREGCMDHWTIRAENDIAACVTVVDCTVRRAPCAPACALNCRVCVPLSSAAIAAARRRRRARPRAVVQRASRGTAAQRQRFHPADLFISGSHNNKARLAARKMSTTAGPDARRAQGPRFRASRMPRTRPNEGSRCLTSAE